MAFLRETSNRPFKKCFTCWEIMDNILICIQELILFKNIQFHSRTHKSLYPCPKFRLAKAWLLKRLTFIRSNIIRKRVIVVLSIGDKIFSDDQSKVGFKCCNLKDRIHLILGSSKLLASY